MSSSLLYLSRTVGGVIKLTGIKLLVTIEPKKLEGGFRAFYVEVKGDRSATSRNFDESCVKHNLRTGLLNTVIEVLLSEGKKDLTLAQIEQGIDDFLDANAIPFQEYLSPSWECN